MRSLRLLPALAAAAAVLLLPGCGSSDDEAGDAAAASGSPSASRDAFPVTIDHAFGRTTIDAKPTRVATVAWANHEVPLALGIVPVGMSKAAWGDDDGDGVLPWVEERLTELGAKTPVLFDEADGIDFEAVADTRPDVILAGYSGLTKEEYDTLSKIAPVVAYPKVAWGTPVQEMIRLESRALGLAAEGERLVAELDRTVAAEFGKHPELKGKSVAFLYVDPKDRSSIGFYTSHDTRPGFLASVGMQMPELVTQRSATSKAFYETVSAEQADRLADADVVVTYGNPDGSTLKSWQADKLLATIPAVRRGAVAILEDSTPLAASANPSPLSIGWGLDDYFALLGSAAARA